ncbi:unnamed protein product [Lactuca saligna]|uniref:Uncharacterized protein n=1 Tax=Lactuca saligna TaxID=75948 RepID=A0AA35ZWQ3_LACSI|nr:unnamed protein product [Lactuca saligna]
MIVEIKNERFTMLLGKTNDLLVHLGVAVRHQKDAEHDGIEPMNAPETELPKSSSALKIGTPNESQLDVDVDLIEAKLDNGVKTSDLLEGQRQYNLVIHSIQEKVMFFSHPKMLFILIFVKDMKTLFILIIENNPCNRHNLKVIELWLLRGCLDCGNFEGAQWNWNS